MDPRFNEIFNSPENEIFKVVFFPDRIYHAPYLNATRSKRYRYNVTEVRGYLDITALKAEVYLDGSFLSNVLRIEYRGARLVEQARIKDRFLREEIVAWVKLLQAGQDAGPESMVKLHYDEWIEGYQVEFWETLEPPPGSVHDFSVLDMMGRARPITRIAAFKPVLKELSALRRIALAFRENDRDLPSGRAIIDPGWDNDFLRSHQEPRTNEPSAAQNTVLDQNYLLDFQRGWFREAKDINPVRYRNAMMEALVNPDAKDDNIIEMRWLFQREFGSSMVFFHEVTVPPGKVEGNHQHIGSEELYFITQGEGTAYLRVGDDPEADARFPTESREVFGIGRRDFKAIPVKPGSMIFTKSGGMHGIRNPNNDPNSPPLKFVAFLYHSS
jgi:mannose-6-phosphate isomerase-like protein (cupin superfamily)